MTATHRRRGGAVAGRHVRGSATQDSVVAIKQIGGTIGRISEIATTIAAAIEEQGTATQEISRNVQQAAAGTTRVALDHVPITRDRNMV